MNPSRYKEAQRVLEFLIEHQAKFSMPRTLKSNDDPCKQKKMFIITSYMHVLNTYPKIILDYNKNFDVTIVWALK